MLKIVLLSLFIEFGVNDIQRTVKLGYFEISLFEWPALKMICKNKKKMIGFKNSGIQFIWRVLFRGKIFCLWIECFDIIRNLGTENNLLAWCAHGCNNGIDAMEVTTHFLIESKAQSKRKNQYLALLKCPRMCGHKREHNTIILLNVYSIKMTPNTYCWMHRPEHLSTVTKKKPCFAEDRS